jgi:hypothetical protein
MVSVNTTPDVCGKQLAPAPSRRFPPPWSVEELDACFIQGRRGHRENLIVSVKPDPVITAINRYRAASADLDKIAVREPTLPNGSPADETEEYAVWETASLKAQDVAATAWAEVTATRPTTVAARLE